MRGSINEILPEPVSCQNEQAILEIIERKMLGAASLGVRVLEMVERRYGPEGRQAIIQDLLDAYEVRTNPSAGDPSEDLHRFCDELESGCVGTHRWERVADEPERIGYRFTRCAWADIYRRLGAVDLGLVICASDEPAVKSVNPALGFRRTQILMEGDEVCDHVFLVEQADEPAGE